MDEKNSTEGGLDFISFFRKEIKKSIDPENPVNPV